MLNRKDSAEVLTQFIESSRDPLVVCIDAPWGQGKTTFLRMWEQHLIDKDIPTIYFNAWENDFTDDALIPLIGEIGSAIDDISKNGAHGKAQEYFKIAKSFGIGLLKRSIPVAAKVATAGALDLDKITEQALATFAESVAKEQLDKYEKSKETLKSFKNALSDLANSFSVPEKHRPLVFIIDELDRCRPTFSIEVLEKAKHIFNVENIIFILGADKVQLGHAIKAIYGNNLDVNGYLRRFIDFDYILPPPDKGLFVKALFKKHSFNDYFSLKKGSRISYEGKQSLEMFAELFEIFKLTLREQEHCCSLLSLSIQTTPTNHHLHPLFLCYLIVLKINAPDVYKKFIHDEISSTQLLDHLSSHNGGAELLENNYGAALEAYIVTSKSSRHDVDVSQYESIQNSEKASEKDKYRANRVLEVIKDLDWHSGIDSLEYLVKKIELASRFKS